MKQLSFLYNITKPNLTLPKVVKPAKKLGRFDYQKNNFSFVMKRPKLFYKSYYVFIIQMFLSVIIKRSNFFLPDSLT